MRRRDRAREARLVQLRLLWHPQWIAFRRASEAHRPAAWPRPLASPCLAAPGTFLVVGPSAAAAGCNDSGAALDSTPRTAASTLDVDGPAATPPRRVPRYLAHLECPGGFPASGGRGVGGEVPGRGRAARPCRRRSTTPASFRTPPAIPCTSAFCELRRVPRTSTSHSYLALTQKNASRVLWAGELKLLAGAVHPRTGARGVMVYFVYADRRPIR